MSARTKVEIEADIGRLEHKANELQAKIASHAEVVPDSRALIEMALQQVRRAATNARQAAATDLDAAATQCERAERNLRTARRLGADSGMSGTGDPKDEWKECRSTIDRFDKLIVDLRKTGFGFITAIVSGAAFFFARGTGNLGAADGSITLVMSLIFFIIAVLIVSLFFIDRVHQILLAESVVQAMELEKDLGYRITERLSKKFRQSHANGTGVTIYVLLLIAAAAIFYVAIISKTGVIALDWYLLIMGVGLLASACAIGYFLCTWPIKGGAARPECR